MPVDAALPCRRRQRPPGRRAAHRAPRARPGRDSRLPPKTGLVYGVSCPSPATCYAVTDSLAAPPNIIKTTDAGSVWKAQSLPLARLQQSLYTVSCSSTTACAVGGALNNASDHLLIDSTSDGGTKWIAGSLRPTETLGLVSGMSCVKESCVAVGEAEESDPVQIWKKPGGTTSWDADGWSYGGGPSQLGILDAVACPSATVCYAVGQATTGTTAAIYDSTNGGSSWHPAALSSSIADLEAISCAGITICEAVGTTTNDRTAVVTTTDGRHWTSG